MRDGWDRVPLGDVAKRWVEGVELDDETEYSNLGVKWYAAGTFQREPKPGSEIKATRLFRVRPGQFVYNRLFATEGSFALVRPEDSDAVSSNEFPVFDLDPSRLLGEYLYLHFQQPSVWATVAEQCVGTTKSRLRWKEERFLAYTIPLPPLDEQRRIVDLVGALDDTIAAAEVARASISNTRSSLVSALSAGGSTRRLGDLATVSQGKSLPKRVQGERSGDTPWFKIADMAQPHNVFGYVSAETMMSPQRIAEVGGRIVEVGAIVFPRVGAAVKTEKKRIMNVAGSLDENHLVLTPNEGVSSEVLLGLLERFSLTSLSQSGAVPSLNMGLIRTAEVLWPPDESVESGHYALMSLRALGASAANHASRLRDLRSNLLTALLSGEHEIPESYDELMGVEAA